MKARGQKFLNESHYEGGTVRWMVSNEETDYNILRKGKDGIESELVITDCSRSIALEFGSENPKQFKKRIAKLDVLIDELGKMRTTLLLVEEDSLRKKKKYY